MSRPSNQIWPAVGSMSRSSSRPTVVLPQPDSPTRPERLAAPDRRSPRRRRPGPRPTVRCRTPPWIGKCLTRSADLDERASPVRDAADASRHGRGDRAGRRGCRRRRRVDECATGSRSSTASARGRAFGSVGAEPTRRARSPPGSGPSRRSVAVDVVVDPAADVVRRVPTGRSSGCGLARDRDVLLDPGRAARREPAARRQVDQVRDVAGDRRQLVADRRPPPGSSRSGPACTDASARGRASRRRPARRSRRRT